MKNFILLVMVSAFAANSEAGCPDFTGIFHSKSDVTATVTFVQTGCESATVVDTHGSGGQTVTATRLFDGHFRQRGNTKYFIYIKYWFEEDSMKFNALFFDRKTNEFVFTEENTATLDDQGNWLARSKVYDKDGAFLFDWANDLIRIE